MNRSVDDRSCGFTLVELLVAVAVLGVLMSILLPSLGKARLKTKVVKVHAELRGICTALESYYNQYSDYPLAQSYCAGQSHSMEQYFELPAELFEGRFLTGRTETSDRHEYYRFRDPFDPNGHSYKYLKPGTAWGNNHQLTRYRVWVPSAFPADTGEDVHYPTYKLNPAPDPPPWERYIIDKHSPVAYATWSCGPGGPVGWLAFQESQMPDGSHLPVPSRNWYPEERKGILCHLMTSKYSHLGQGHCFTSP